MILIFEYLKNNFNFFNVNFQLIIKNYIIPRIIKFIHYFMKSK